MAKCGELWRNAKIQNMAQNDIFFFQRLHLSPSLAFALRSRRVTHDHLEMSSASRQKHIARQALAAQTTPPKIATYEVHNVQTHCNEVSETLSWKKNKTSLARKSLVLPPAKLEKGKR